MQKGFVLIAVAVSLAVIVGPALAQFESFSINTSKEAYEGGESVVISGRVAPVIQNTPVVIQIFCKNNLIYIEQINIAQDGRFTDSVKTGGPVWKDDGLCSVKGSYGEDNSVETTFDFTAKKTLGETSGISEVNAGSSGTFDVEYTIAGAIVNEMVVDYDDFSLRVVIDSPDDGSIALRLPRDSIDAMMGGADIDYIVLIDGRNVPYEQVSQSDLERTLMIDFESGDSEIQIIGTFIIPEFGTLTMLVLALTIVAATVLSSRFWTARQI